MFRKQLGIVHTSEDRDIIDANFPDSSRRDPVAQGDVLNIYIGSIEQPAGSSPIFAGNAIL
jgi:hypothetical protein